MISTKLSSDSTSVTLSSTLSMPYSTLKTLIPSQFISFATPNIINCCYIRARLLRIAILDSPVANANEDSPIIAAMIVPEHWERDWMFCTESGHLQLLFHYNLSRLILIGNKLNPNLEHSIYIRPTVINPVDKETIESKVRRLVISFHPKVCFRNGLPQPLFLTCEDDVMYRVIIEKFVGPSVGEFLVEDVELESKEFRRRLRFKRMPNLIQSQVTRVGDIGLDLEILRQLKEVDDILIDTKVLVEQYLTCMVSGFFLIVSPLNERIKQGFSPRALCLGVGGGSLLSFLNTQLGFEVVGVEIDAVVLNAARKYFGLKDETSIKLIVGDAIELLQKVAHDSNVNIDGLNAKFDVVMVDLVSNLARSRVSAPPPRFVSKPVFQAIRSLLHDHGLLVIHVIPANNFFHESIIQKLQDVFHKVYEIDAKNDREFVLMATLTPIASNDHANAFLERLRSVISGSYMLPKQVVSIRYSL